MILVERNATLGGRTALLYRYFPKMCHPTCGLEINLCRLKGNRNVRVMTMTEVVDLKGLRGDYTVTLKLSPRYVNANCTACGDCAIAVEAEIDNPYETSPAIQCARDELLHIARLATVSGLSSHPDSDLR